MTAGTGFFTDERCFWHGGGNYALTLPVGGFVQPGGGLPESPETKRRLKNLLEVSGLMRELSVQSAPEATREELLRVHPASYLDAFKAASDAGGGELGLRTPFGRGGYEIAALSAGLATGALRAVLKGDLANAYSLSRPPGHHALPDFPNGFCLLNNIAIAVRAVQAEGLARRVAVIDWDVHHGNGTEAIFWEDPEVLTLSIHQERNYPLDTGDAMARGAGRGHGFNVNLPLPPGAGHDSYLQVMDRIILPLLARFRPEVIVVACGYDASAMDPLGRMLATAETFRELTRMAKAAAGELCGSRLVLVHEGGYSEVHVPFCGHAVMEELSGSGIRAPDPLAATLAARQPGPAASAFHTSQIDALAAMFL
ncbi:class II histone deacetylase [Frigidibacter albus]|uniref:Class II histone deacetylase n=1 Tax=Frigidibacter albus TaxID=1465486 RepID=A0A6L8VFD8_9RHOB|nr:class II histone deacetylase [Frigidibacter albus]MZQ88953.1 class II histone deacetylase [Frigidibacter albus]NBE30990.1 class II histone deacetylase [Frigidibacter albus]GGH52249.1 class II histone deacetylase [Frigidibacter albus]